MTTVTDADREAATNGDWDALIAELVDRHRTQAHAAGLAEGIAIGIEAARGRLYADDVDAALRNLNTPAGIAAVLAQHKRAKAMDELIAADADLL